MIKRLTHRSNIADILLGCMFILITVLYAMLMFTENVPLAGYILLGILWLVLIIASRRITFATPMDTPIIGLLILLPLSLYVSIDREVSLSKIHGLLLSTAIFYVIVNSIRRKKRLQMAGLAIVLLSLLTVILGFLGTDWNDSNYAFINFFYKRLPNIFPILTGSTAGAGINANTLGGALTFFLPLLVSLIWDKGGFNRMFLKDSSRNNLKHVLYKSIIGMIILLVLAALILTQSRGAILGCAFGLLVLAIWKDRNFLWLLPVIGLYFLVAWQSYAKGSLVDLVAMLDTSGEATIQTRLDLWQHAIYLIQDFPITGIGLSDFGAVFNSLYNFNIFTRGYPYYFHAHNTILTIAVEMGLPALVLYCSLLGSYFSMAHRTYKTGRAFIRTMVIGLSCGMIAHQVFGLTDAYSLGKKLGVIMWIYFGLMTALYLHRHRFYGKSHRTKSNLQMRSKPDREYVKRHLLNMLLGFLYWLLVSLSSIAFINLSPYISLAVAIAGGALLGIHLTHQYRETTKKLAHSS